MGADMILRERMFTTILSIFKRHGGIALDTPVFELKEILSGKYGEDSKLIYDLQDQGGELCSLRYDLTVPFARVLAMNPTLQSIKRYHLAKVYRRDQPALKKGRMREFFQCDFDIAGTSDPMIADAEVLEIVNEVLSTLDIGQFTIKINHRKLLDGIFEVCGVPKEKIRTISSAVDKLDKSPWEDVRKEMTEEKGLDGEVADAIWEFVQQKGGRELVTKLKESEKLMSNEHAKVGLDEMEILFEYLEALGSQKNISFDLSLARGLDYYTGLIYEAVTETSRPKVQKSAAQKDKRFQDPDADRSEDDTLGVGSISGGGRYDELVGMFSSNKKNALPCVGLSIGVERIFSILKSKEDLSKIRDSETEVFVMAFGSGFTKERLRVCKALWDADIKAEYTYKAKPKPKAQFDGSEKSGAKLAVILGQDEIDQGQVRVKVLGLGDDSNKGEAVSFSEMVPYVRKLLSEI